MPTLLGEVESIRSIQLLPGVSTVGEGASGFNVRGGSIDQNLILLDEAPVYNSSHLFGFFSVINPENTLRFGGQAIYYTFNPGTAVGVSEGETADISLDDKYALESAIYLENEHKISDKVDLHYDLRLSHFDYLGKGRSYKYGGS